MINSTIEQDMYKITMGQVVFFLFPSVHVEYRFTNRGKTPFPEGFEKELRNAVDLCQRLETTPEEVDFISTECPFLSSVYIDFLKNFKYDPNEVTIKQRGGILDIRIQGPWKTTIFWEVVLMAMISELYFKMTGQDPKDRFIREGVNKAKAKDFLEVGAKVAEFGMRRRYSASNHREVLADLIEYAGDSLIGTSNVKLAMDYGIKSIGTMAHEFIMAESVLRGLRYANRYAMEDWNRIYRGDLGIVLTDTFGLDAFLKDFDKGFAKQFDGVRHDSGCPKLFADRIITHYKSLGINPLHKTIIFSDGLDILTVKELVKYCEGRVNCSFGIGTNLTNDVGVKALNMVIKLYKVNEIPVVKLSDIATKATGDPKAVDVAKWTFGIGEYE